MDKDINRIVTDDVKAGYEELVKELKSQYSAEIFRRIDDAKDKSYKSLSKTLKNHSPGIFEEVKNLKNRISKIKNEFYNTSEYIEAQSKLVGLRVELDSTDEKTRKEIEKNFSRAMDRISTLNVTINNRVKPLSDKLNADILELKSLAVSPAIDFDNVKADFLDEIDKILSEGIGEFNDRLSEIRARFGIKDANPELPFEENSLKIHIELFPSEIIGGREDLIVSDNENPEKN